MTQINTSPPEQAYLLRTHMANYALFLSGMFAERVHAHAQRRGAPSLSFYEAVGPVDLPEHGRSSAGAAVGPPEIFELLGAEFRRVRLALNDLADTLLHLHETPSIFIRPS